MKRLLSLVVAVVSLAACNGDGGGDEASDTTSTSAVAAKVTSSTAATTAGGGETSPTTAAGGESQATTTSTPDGGRAGGTGRVARPPEFEAELALTCLRAGERQTLTVTEAEPERPVLYSSKYSDGSTVVSKGYDSGDGNGTTDEEGRFTESWTVPPTAPPGPATLDVAVWADYDEDPQARRLGFTIKPAGQSC